jgi:OMF family outer membrane factor
MLKRQGIQTLLVCLGLMVISQSHPANAAPSKNAAEQFCAKPNFQSLIQALLPEAAAPLAELPLLPPLEVPQQSGSVTIQQTLPLTLPLALRLAFERNADLKVSQLQAERSCAELKEAKAINFPIIQARGSFSRTDDGRFTPANRDYSTTNGSAVSRQIAALLAQQQALSLRQFQQQLQELQQRLQQSPSQVQRDTFQQQLQQLQERTENNADLGDPLDLTPLTASNIAPAFTGGTRSTGGDGGYFNSSLSLSYPIWTGGRRPATLQLARKQVETTLLDVKLTLQQLRESVTTRYYDLQQTQALIAVATSTVANAQENLRIIQIGEREGVRTRFEILQAEVALADARQNLTQANALADTARRQLVQQLQLPPTVDVNLPTGLLATPSGTWPLSLEASIILALQHRPELTQIRYQQEIAQLQKRVVASQKQPQLQGIASFNIADDLEDQFLGAYGYTVGVQMSFDVFDGGAVRSQLRQLDRTIDLTTQQFNQQREVIRLEVEQAYYSLKANATNIETARLAITQAEESLRLAQLRLQAGVGTTLEVTRAQADLTQAQSNLIAATLDYNRALANLERVTGYATAQSKRTVDLN